MISSVAQSCLTFCDPVDCSTLGLPVHHQLPSLLKLMSTESVMPSNHLILRRPLLLLPSIFPSIRVFSSESVLHIRWPKEYIKAVYCHPAYLTYMESTSCEMLVWMKHKPESRLPGEISITSDMQMTPPLGKK